MMQFLSDNIDQLDLALDQLAVDDLNFDRFALMLIDNVAELTLHNYAQDKARENEMWGQLSKSKYDLKSLQMALGQHFTNKVKFAIKTGLIDDFRGVSILNLHVFRNTIYHKGLRHAGILHSISLFYFINACEILKDYSSQLVGIQYKDKMSHRARKYLGSLKSGNHKQVLKEAYQRLSDVAASMKGNLVNDLYVDMAATIESIDGAIQFLAKYSPKKRTRKQVIIYSQAWPFAFTEEGKSFAKKNGCHEKYIGPYVDWIAKTYNWPVKSDPISSWRKRLDALKREKNTHKALKRYCDFMKQTEDIRSQIHRSAIHLDRYIEGQVEAAREE